MYSRHFKLFTCCKKKFSFRKSLTVEEKKDKTVAQREKKKKDKDDLVAANWRLVDVKKECFVLEEKPLNGAFLTFKLRNTPGISGFGRSASELD